MESTLGSGKNEEQKPIFTTAGEVNPTLTTDSYNLSDTSRSTGLSQEAATFSSILSGVCSNDLLNMNAQQEPKVADTAPSVSEMEELLTSMRFNANESMFSEELNNSNMNYFSGYSRPESTSSSSWPDANGQGSRNNEMMDTFDFLVKSLSSANNYLSMLTREQVMVLRSIRPSLLYDFLQEVAKARSNRRSMFRSLPNECAFCKNNGENEECYSTHVLKDSRGRVLCPVLRAFRCPRCGATGDRAHTIKYCPEPADTASASFPSRRRMPPSLLLGSNQPRSLSTPGPSASPVTSPVNPISYASIWSNFNMN